jgi:hypothetical protein
MVSLSGLYQHSSKSLPYRLSAKVAALVFPGLGRRGRTVSRMTLGPVGACETGSSGVPFQLGPLFPDTRRYMFQTVRVNPTAAARLRGSHLV